MVLRRRGQFCRLESRGPSWQSPSLTEVLRRQPFLADQVSARYIAYVTTVV
jgi:hypothetical protein